MSGSSVSGATRMARHARASVGHPDVPLLLRCRSGSVGGLRRFLRLLGLLVRDARVAVDARGLAGEELLVLLLRVLGLLLRAPCRRVVAGAAVGRVVFAHLFPDVVGQPPALLGKLF